MISIAVIVAYFTFFVLANFLLTSALEQVTKRKFLQVLKEKEQKIVSVLLHLLYMSILTSFSLWFTVIAWDHTKGDVLVDGYQIYLEIIQLGVGFYVYDVVIMKPQKARLIHHFVSLMAYIMILEENRIVWYGAVMNIEAYKIALIAMQLLYYFDKSETTVYKVVRGFRMLLWIVFKGGCSIISITKSIIHGFPNVYAGYQGIMISSSVLISLYSLYILYQDGEYFYKLIFKPNKKKSTTEKKDVAEIIKQDTELKPIETTSYGPNGSSTLNLV